MSISRRQFILGAPGAVAGFILPSFYDRALSYFENHGELLIVLPKESDVEIRWIGRRQLDSQLKF